MREKILSILSEVCETTEVVNNPDIEVYNLGMLDSFGTVQFLVALEEKLNINVSITEIDRDVWATPNKIISYLEAKISQ